MNETAAARKEPGMARLILILFVISVVTSLLLGLVDYITRDIIEANTAEQTREAMGAALVADEYVPVTYSGGDPLVTAVHEARTDGQSTGYVVEVAPSGFGGTINMVVGVDLDGLVTGVSIVTMSETSGLGTNANQSSFRDQYIGQGGTLAVTKDGGTIDALTGATVTSRAVTDGVNAAIAAAESLMG